jgi:hypothetical protein
VPNRGKNFILDWQISGRERDFKLRPGRWFPQTARYQTKKARRAHSQTPHASGGSLVGAHRKRNGKLATLSFITATPGHGLKRLKEVDEFSLLKRPIRPGIERPNKAPAIRDKAVHGIADTWVRVPAGINAIRLGKTSDVPNL